MRDYTSKPETEQIWLSGTTYGSSVCFHLVEAGRHHPHFNCGSLLLKVMYMWLFECSQKHEQSPSSGQEEQADDAPTAGAIIAI